MARDQIRSMSNKQLVYYVKRDRDERENPEKHTRYVHARKFWGASGMTRIRSELKRRQKAGTVSKQAGVRRARRSSFGSMYRL